MNTMRDGEEQDLFGHVVDGESTMETPELPLAPPPRPVKLSPARQGSATPATAAAAEAPSPKPPVRLQSGRKATAKALPATAGQDAPGGPVPPVAEDVAAPVPADADADATSHSRKTLAETTAAPPPAPAAAPPPSPAPSAPAAPEAATGSNAPPATTPTPRPGGAALAAGHHSPRPLRLTGHGGHPPTRGQLLQEARVRCDLSLEQVAIATKIKRQFLESIERDDAEHLPPEVYVKAYVRRLCHHYGLDEEQVLALAAAPPPKATEKAIPNEILQHIEEGKQVNPAEEKRIRNLTWAAVAALVLLAGAGVGIYLGQRPPSPRDSDAPPVLVAVDPVAEAALAAEIALELERRSPPPPPSAMGELPLP